MMRRLTLLLLSGALLSVGSAAQAGPRRPVYKAPPPAPVIGSAIAFYAGVHMGYGWSRFSSDTATSLDASGFLGGAQVGANYQIDKFVIGVEGDFSQASVQGNTSGTIGGTPVTAGARHLWFATLAGRVGYAFDRTLAYVKGGAAWTQYKWDLDAPAVGAAFSTQTRTGWMAGIGVEQAVTDAVSVKLEYNYLGFGTRTDTLTTTGGIVAAPADVKLDAQLVKLGVNYRFGSPR